MVPGDFASRANQQRIRDEFKHCEDMCYLDHTGAALYPHSQMTAIAQDLCSHVYGNPHSASLSSKLCHDSVDLVRFRVAQHFNTNINEYHVIFTSGATESLKIVAESFDWCSDGIKEDDGVIAYCNGNHCSCSRDSVQNSGTFVYLQDNHTSVLGMREVAKERGAKVVCLTHNDAFKVFNGDWNAVDSASRPVGVSNCLFAYPAQCNFSGIKYPLSWVDRTHRGALDSLHSKGNRTHDHWFCLLDAATHVSTNALDLSAVKPDFVCVSFYKIFGYPTGLGALLVRSTASAVLIKRYYGGGTVQIALSSQLYHVDRPELHKRFENGTINFLAIVSLHHCFQSLYSLAGSMVKITNHCFRLARYTFYEMLCLHHANGRPAIKLYTDTDYSGPTTQGNIVNFNVLRGDGSYIGYVEVLNMANLHKIQLRTGCFCNPGACQRHLRHTDEELKSQFQAGHVCGDDIDLINGQPTGSVRISFGYYSTRQDADRLVRMLSTCFVAQPALIKTPDNWSLRAERLMAKFKGCVTVGGINGLGADTGDADGISEVVTEAVDIINVAVRENKFSGITTVGNAAHVTNRPYYLSHIFVYPVKSCSHFAVTTNWPIDSRGLAWDRQWMVVTGTGVALTQKQQPRLCLVRPRIDLQRRLLVLSCTGLPECDVPLDSVASDAASNIVKSSNHMTMCQSKVCGDRVEVWDCGERVATWLQRALGSTGLRLIRQLPRDQRRKRTQNPSPALSLTNQAQFLLINNASVAWLADQLDPFSDCSKESMLFRFRSNFVVSGGDEEAFVERGWKEIAIGTNRFKVDGACGRCQMICIDQVTGARTKEPLTTLSAALQGALKFGIYLTHLPEQGDSVKISIGDRIKAVS